MNILIAYWILSGIIYALMLFKTIDDVITGDDEWLNEHTRNIILHSVANHRRVLIAFVVLFAITIGGIATPVVIIKKLING